MNIALYFYCEITVWNSNNLSYVNNYLCYQNTIKIYLIKLEGCHIVILIILCVKLSYLSALLIHVVLREAAQEPCLESKKRHSYIRKRRV